MTRTVGAAVRTRPSRTPGPDPAAPAPRPLRVLVARDNEFNAQLMEQLLARRGHHAQLAGDGRQALALASEGKFDLLLLDVHMPEMDGFEVIRAIRERERNTGEHLPVIALTARSRAEDRERCLAAGMDDFLAKPVKVPDLFAALDRVTRENRHAPAAQSLLSPASLLAACENDPALLQKLWGGSGSAPEHVATLAAARTARDLRRLRDTAHKLAGMLAVFSVPAGELASAAEDRAAAGELDAAAELSVRVEAATAVLLHLTEELSLERVHTLASQELHRQ